MNAAVATEICAIWRKKDFLFWRGKKSSLPPPSFSSSRVHSAAAAASRPRKAPGGGRKAERRRQPTFQSKNRDSPLFRKEKSMRKRRVCSTEQFIVQNIAAVKKL